MPTRPPVAATLYPSSSTARDRFVLDRRRGRVDPDPWRFQDVIVEDERTADGRTARTATVFLTGRECPWRCVMCDLWRYTTAGDTPKGAIPAQVAAARERLRSERRPVTHLKLYNAGSFFDPRAVPEQDYDAVAAAVGGFEQVVVESHPALIGERVDRFLDTLDVHRPDHGAAAQLEVAMGLETVHPAALERLHKRMTVRQFVDAAHRLSERRVEVRVFLLIAPPFVPAAEQDAWLQASIDTAFGCGASVVTLIPTRGGNGAMETLSADGSFRLPNLDAIERSVEVSHARLAARGESLASHRDGRGAPPARRDPGAPDARFPARWGGGDREYREYLSEEQRSPRGCIARRMQPDFQHGLLNYRGRLFVDLWNLEQFSECPICLNARRDRLHTINLEQRIPPPIVCAHHERRE